MLRKKPAYPQEQWSKYEDLFGGESRTNNIMDGYNNGFSISLPARATEWTLIERFKVEESLAKTTLHQAAVGNNGPDMKNSKNLNMLDREQKLKNLVNNFHNLSLDTFMESLIPYCE
jgi:hypothetical protein